MRKLVILLVAVMMLMATAAFAARRTQGGAKENMLSIGLVHGTNEYVTPAGTADYLIPASTFSPGGTMPELGINVEYGVMMAPDYRLAIGFDYLWGSEKLQPTTNALPGTPDVKVTSASWRIRIGGDRVGNIGDRFQWFLGPGLEYQSGKPKYENAVGAGSIDGPNTNKWGLNGRVGGVMLMNPKMGIFGRIGDTVGSASTSEDKSGKNTWFYSNFEAAWGLQFKLGG
jgi:hypothetical protein